MRRPRRALAAVSLVTAGLAFPVAARAQTAPPLRDAPSQTSPAAPYTPPADPRDEVLRRLLRSGCHDGLAEARALAARGEPWAETVARLCGEILLTQPAAPPRAARDKHERDGRGTLVIASTIYGIWTGVAVDVLSSVNNVRPAILPPLVGMGAGLALSLAITADHPLTNGQAWSIVTGLEYGSFNGAMWAGALDLSTRSVVGTTFATGLAAGAAGLVVATRRSPTQGDVEVVRSGLLWGTVGGMLGIATFEPTVSQKSFWRGAAVSMDFGFLAGLALASSFEVSRTRDLIIDAGTLGGGVAGLGVTVLALGTNSGSGRAIAGGALVGMVAGMVLTTVLTRDLDDPDDPDGPDAPVAALLGRDARGRWRWGTPGAMPVLDGLGRRVVGATFTALGGNL
jgi:hypothetical protein